MGNPKLRGIGNNSSTPRIDTRGGFEKFMDGFTEKKAAVIPVVAGIASFIPAVQPHADMLFGCSLPIAGSILLKNVDVPFDKPHYHDRKSPGYFFFGNELGTNKEIWLSDSEARKHILIFGTTGAGFIILISLRFD
ncbi:hypothetical protein [Photobacterium kishitanii]|uniref:Uncharacterized protein n=1 Tax=Photobacterium kishitanii TaxID=318456 RepID=A0A2T3KN25_9GAMM|nr:hypothetical protein [Photobacterium kishitanii]PSV01200.1 hypothetical protein C9J27_04020 [Photobacterium kishitanii]